MRSWLSNPLVALVLGALAGSCLAFVNRFGARFMTADDDSGLGMAVTLGLFTAGLVVAVGLMFAYRAVAAGGLAPFGGALSVGLIVATVLAVLPQVRGVRTGTKGR